MKSKKENKKRQNKQTEKKYIRRSVMYTRPSKRKCTGKMCDDKRERGKESFRVLHIEVHACCYGVIVGSST